MAQMVAAGQAPAVFTPEAFVEDEQDAMFTLQLMMLSVRWRHETNPELSPLKGAKVLVDGWSQFRIDYVNDLSALKPLAPHIINRINFDGAARDCWRLLKGQLRAWLKREFDFEDERDVRKVTPRQVIKWFEKNYREESKPPPLSKSEFEIEHTGYQAGMIDGFRSSGTKRVGTIRQIIEDVADEGVKRRTHQLVDQIEDEEKRGGA